MKKQKTSDKLDGDEYQWCSELIPSIISAGDDERNYHDTDCASLKFKPTILDVEKLRKVYGFDVAAIWHHLETPITFDEIRSAIKSYSFIEKPLNISVLKEPKEMPAREQHIRRIAYLVTHPSTEHININLYPPNWAIEDGNHRLAAAIFRGDKTIKACVEDYYGDQKEWFLKEYEAK